MKRDVKITVGSMIPGDAWMVYGKWYMLLSTIPCTEESERITISWMSEGHYIIARPFHDDALCVEAALKTNR